MRNARRLRHRLGQDHARLPAEGAPRHPRGRAGVERRRQRRGRAARRLLPHGARSRGASTRSPRSPIRRSPPASTAFRPILPRASRSAPWRRKSPRVRAASRAWCSAASRRRARSITRLRSRSWGWFNFCRPGRAKRGPGPIRRALSIASGVWVPAFAGTTVDSHTFGSTSSRTTQFSSPGFAAG